MKPSPLILKKYFVSNLSLAANPNFKRDLPLELLWDDLHVESDYAAAPEDVAQWQLRLKVQHRANLQRNHTYSFDLEMVGLFDVNAGFPADKHEQLVQVNGASILYGAAREVIRSATAHGPFSPIMLPSVSFVPNKKDVTSTAQS